MSAARACVLIVVFAALAFALVCLRAAQTRCIASLLAYEARELALQRERWDVQTRAARLRSPTHLHDRLANFQTGLIPPIPPSHTDHLSVNVAAHQQARLTSHAPR